MTAELLKKLQLGISKKIKEDLFIDLSEKEIFSLEIIDTSYLSQERFSSSFMGMTIDVYLEFEDIKDIIIYKLAS